MKGKMPKIILLLGIISFIIGDLISYGMNISYAEDLKLVGKNIGLEIIPESRRLFDLTNLNPGDTFEANLNIANKHTAPFELFMRTERMGDIPKGGEADLFKQLLLTVYLEESEIFSGSMMDYATSNISLGNFDRDDAKTLRAIVHLPGPETGNEFQDKKLDVKWIFTAQTDKEKFPDPHRPDPEDITIPKTGDKNAMIFYGISGVLSGLGIWMSRKKKE